MLGHYYIIKLKAVFLTLIYRTRASPTEPMSASGLSPELETVFTIYYILFVPIRINRALGLGIWPEFPWGA